VLDSLPPWLRAEVDATARAIRRAAADYEALPVSPERSDETPLGEIGARSERDHGDGLDVGQAALLLGVSPRRVQQLAAGGMGRKAGRAWLLDPTVVREYGRRRAG
jgi:hypothetical protein